MKFSKKIVVSILLIQIVSSLVHSYLNHYQYLNVLKTTIEKKECDTNYLVGTIFNELREKYSNYAKELLLDPKILDAFANADRQKLYQLSEPIYKSLKRSDKYLYIMNFYTTDTHAFLRMNKPEQFGGNLQSFRKMIVRTNETKEAQYGVESGKHGLFYRVMFPVFKDGVHIGVFEFGVDIKYLMSRLSILNLNTPMLLITKKAAAPMYMYDENVNDYFDEFTNEYVILKFDTSRDKDVSIADVVDKQIIEKSSYIVKIDFSDYLLYRGYALQDYKNSPIGHFVFMEKMDYYMDTIVFVRRVSILTTALLLIVIILLLYKLISDYAREIMIQKDILDYRTHYDS
ncbi:cache domain-containing protein, partial [Sulfurimonas sp.]|uniref:cache domain-containing protein n=1 Tax=Sulfurimonas sp. TaxID=2022749 RepID=UPI0019DAB2FA